MTSTSFDLNQLPVNSQSPASSSPGLDDLDWNAESFLGTNSVNEDADEEVDHGLNNPELNEEGERLQLETPVRKKELTSAERLVAYQCLLERLTLQTCMIEVLKCDGSNTYKIPHIKKKSLARLGNLPSIMQCPLAVFANAVALISQ